MTIINKTKNQQAFFEKRSQFVNFIFIISFSFIFIGIYIFYVNQLAFSGYNLKELESRLKEVSKENEKLKMAFSEAKGLLGAAVIQKELGMINVKKINYLKIIDSKTAFKP